MFVLPLVCGAFDVPSEGLEHVAIQTETLSLEGVVHFDGEAGLGVAYVGKRLNQVVSPYLPVVGGLEEIRFVHPVELEVMDSFGLDVVHAARGL